MKKRISFNEAMQTLGVCDRGVVREEAWLEAQAAFPENFFCLSPDWLEQVLAKLKMPDDVNAAFRTARPLFAGHPVIPHLIWYFARMLDAGTSASAGATAQNAAARGSDAQLRNWPDLGGVAIPQAPMLFAFVCLSGLPRLEELHRQRGIDPAITYDTMSDIALWIKDFYQKTGKWGLDGKIIPWIAGYLSGRLVKLGRLQYCPARFPYDLPCFVRKHDGHVLMLAGEGAQFGTAGRYYNAGAGAVAGRMWTACRQEGADSVVGNPISAHGAAHNRRMVLFKRDWQQVLRRNDPILQVHIPASGPLDPEACRQSLRRVRVFFARHYPETDFQALTCVSWLMDNQFGRYLARNANIRQFQSLFYLHPIPGASERQTYERVFGDSRIDVEQAPQNTSLQRLVVAHVRKGGRWYDGGGVIIRAAWSGSDMHMEGGKRYTI